MKRQIRNSLVILFGVGILFFLLSKVQGERVVALLWGSDPFYLILGIALSLIQPVFDTMKWNLLLKSKRITIPFYQLFFSQMIGLFVSSFLPSRYSGDIYRAYVVAKHSGQAHDSAAAVLVQRLSGLFVMGLLSFIASTVGFVTLGDYTLVRSVMAGSVAIVVGCFLVFSEKVFRGFDRVLEGLNLSIVRKPAAKFHMAVMEYKDKKELIAKICLLSLLFYLGAFIIVFGAARAVRAEVSLLYVVLVVPIIYLLEALPISINGLGVREGAFAFFFTRVGVSLEQAVAAALVVLFFRLLKSGAGGVLFVFRYVEFKSIKKPDTLLALGRQDGGRIEG